MEKRRNEEAKILKAKAEAKAENESKHKIDFKRLNDA